MITRGRALGLLVSVAAVGTMVVCMSAVGADPDGGVCARNNGVPFYIPPEGYQHGPEEVITGPVHAGHCTDSDYRQSQQTNNNSPNPDRPDIPQDGSQTTTTTTTNESAPDS